LVAPTRFALNSCLYGSDPRERGATAQTTLQLPSGYMQPVNAKRSEASPVR